MPKNNTTAYSKNKLYYLKFYQKKHIQSIKKKATTLKSIVTRRKKGRNAGHPDKAGSPTYHVPLFYQNQSQCQAQLSPVQQSIATPMLTYGHGTKKEKGKKV